MSDVDGDEQPTVYAVRLTHGALDDIAEARKRRLELTDDTTAEEWEASLVDGLSRLATFPNGYPMVAEARRFPGLTVRQMLHRRTSSANVAHRALFLVQDEGPDGPVVTVFHIRHASRRPISASEAAGLRGSISQ